MNTNQARNTRKPFERLRISAQELESKRLILDLDEEQYNKVKRFFVYNMNRFFNDPETAAQDLKDLVFNDRGKAIEMYLSEIYEVVSDEVRQAEKAAWTLNQQTQRNELLAELGAL